jgi:hypothetical protein
MDYNFIVFYRFIFGSMPIIVAILRSLDTLPTTLPVLVVESVSDSI